MRARPFLMAAAAAVLMAGAAGASWAEMAPASTPISLRSAVIPARGIRVSQVPRPLTTLLSIACVSSTRCYGAGLIPSGRGAIVPVSSGRAGTPITVRTGLEGISCFGPSACEAVGGIGRSQLAAVVPITGSHPGQVREVGGGVYVLQNVSCESSDVCEAVGGDQGVLVQTVNGTPSESQGVPGIGDFASISCAGDTCEAVGNGIDTLDGSYASIIDGTPAGTHPEPDAMALQAISCTAAASCEAAGGFAYPHRHEGVIASIRDGKLAAWHILSSLAIFSAIACPTASACYAIADRDGADRTVQTVLVTIVGGHAVSQRTLPDTLNSIACPSAKLCYAAGNAPTKPYDGVVVKVPVSS